MPAAPAPKRRRRRTKAEIEAEARQVINQTPPGVIGTPDQALDSAEPSKVEFTGVDEMKKAMADFG